jgi:hypothetical protein
MTHFEKLAYVVGWNDTEHGIRTYPPPSQLCLEEEEEEETPLEWALKCKKIAEEMTLICAKHCRAYYKGVIECVLQYENTGDVERK